MKCSRCKRNGAYHSRAVGLVRCRACIEQDRNEQEDYIAELEADIDDIHDEIAGVETYVEQLNEELRTWSYEEDEEDTDKCEACGSTTWETVPYKGISVCGDCLRHYQWKETHGCGTTLNQYFGGP